MADQKLSFNINLGEFSTWELVSDTTDYELEFVTQKFQTTDPICRTKTI